MATVPELDPPAVAALGARIADNVASAVKVPPQTLRHVVVALIAEGHVLIEDYPGVGKTALARALARSVDAEYARVQCTADLLPADVVGTNVFNQRENRFEFRPGPVFANVVLVDEINRTTPRTQSALLEAMDENAVTVDGVRHSLPEPLFVVATQNPLEHHGTYPLPEGQLDRFALAMELGYVDRATEAEIVRAQLEAHPIDELDAALDPDEVMGVRSVVRSTHVSEPVLSYALALATATRSHDELELGASPRASITLVRCAQARALIQGRDFVVPDDVKALAVASLAHRVVPAVGLRLERQRVTQLVADIVESTPVPVTGPPTPP